MGLPSVNISFIEKAVNLITRSERGIVALVLKETVAKDPVTVLTTQDMPTGITAFNKNQIEQALIGYVNAPKKVIVYFIVDGEEVDYVPAYEYLETVRFDYLAIPSIETDNMASNVIAWVKAQRVDGKMFKVVLPDADADYEGVINFTTSTVTTVDAAYTAADYCSRIAGLLAGTPLTISCTYAPLPEVTTCSKLSKSAMDTAIENGEFIIFHDGEKVKVGRGVNSLTTTTATKGYQFTKIKIVEVMDMIYDDIKKTTEDSYIGKYANSYDNKCLLISAISGYFDRLILDGILESYSVGVDIDAQRRYLMDIGVSVEDLTDEQIKVYNTGDKVFLNASVKILDAIEEVILPISI